MREVGMRETCTESIEIHINITNFIHKLIIQFSLPISHLFCPTSEGTMKLFCPFFIFDQKKEPKTELGPKWQIEN